MKSSNSKIYMILSNLYHSSSCSEFLFAFPKHIFDFCRYRLISDETFVKKHFRSKLGFDLDLKNPVSFAEKIQWLKLNDRNPLYTLCADKYLVRDFIKDNIGEEYLIPIIYSTDNPKTINFSKLPRKYIIKTNHASGTNVVVLNDMMFYKGDWCVFNKNKIINYYKKCLKLNVFYTSREWEYKNIKPLILIEELLSDDSGNSMLSDYKIHCFKGQPLYVQTIHDRECEVKETWYDTDWNDLDCYYFSKIKNVVDKPQNLTQMLDVAKKLSQQFNYVRVDLYSIDEKIYFGELTFHPYSGGMNFVPSKWNKIIGDKITLDIE